MTTRKTGIALSLLAALGIAAAGYQISRLDRQRMTAGDAAQAFDRLAARAETLIAELRASQQAYVAAGQGLDFWIKRTGELIDGVNRHLIELKQTAMSRETATSLGAAAQEIDNFVGMDKRVQEFAHTGDLTTASDMIFSDGLEMTGAAARSIETAREQERQLRDPALLATRRMEASIAIGAAAGVLLLFGVVALKRPTAPEQLAGSSFARRETPAGDGDMPLRTTPRSPRDKPPGEHAPVPVVEPLPDLAGVAMLCSDLARVTAAAELPALLQRCAAILDASGIVVWLADSSGSELRPVLWHGYGPQALSRIPAIPRDADNATAAAFRTEKLATVPGRGTSAGAIITPLIGPSGCAGVLTAELPEGGETRPAVLAFARIVAAQLAGLVANVPAANSEPAPVSQPAAAAQ